MVSDKEVQFAGTDRYELKRQLGIGASGVVYEAFDREQNIPVALKVLRTVDAAAELRFKNEFRVLQGLQHPNLVTLEELAKNGDVWFFTMELIDGVDFLAYVRDETGAPPFDEARLRSVLGQLALGLFAVHGSGSIHRDVKPSNVLVTAEGRAVLLDFGLATRMEPADQSTTRHTVGTAAYMAPEQAASKRIGPAADWYALGVLMYEALTGRLPFSGTILKILMDKQQYQPAPPRARMPDVPRDLDALCVELLSCDPQARPCGRTVLKRLGIDDALPLEITSCRFTQGVQFVGRDEELAALAAAFAESRDEPVVAIVRGESGLGKSELVRRFTEIVRQKTADAVILSGRCYERESAPYKAFDGIADELATYLCHLSDETVGPLLPSRATLLARLFPTFQRVEAISRARWLQEILDPQELRRRMFDALRQLLDRLSRRHPLVLVIDDLQWADADSLALLGEILSHAQAPRLFLMATMRPVADLELRQSLAAMLQRTRCHTIELTSLSQQAAVDLVLQLLPTKDEAQVLAIVQEAGGHPLYLQELARYSEAHGDAGATSLDEALWSRVSQLPNGPRRLLEIVSVAGSPIPQEAAANAAKMSYADHTKAASSLRVAYFVRTEGMRRVDSVAVYHDRVREVVLGHLSAATVKHHHERLAIALESAGAASTHPHALIRHAEASGDTERAAAYAETAARHAVNAMAFDQAAEFFRTALRLGQYDDDRKRALHVQLADTFVNAGRAPEAATLFLVAAETADPATKLEYQRKAAEQWLISGHIERGLDTIANVLTEIGVTMPATAHRALASLLWNRFKLRVRGLSWVERHRDQIAPADLVRAETFRVIGYAIAIVDPIRGADFQSRAILLALRTGEINGVARALALEAAYISTQGVRKYRRARKLFDKACAIAKDRDDAYLQAFVQLSEGFVSYLGAGEFRLAFECFSKSERSFLDVPGATWELSSARLARLWPLRHMGKLSRLGSLFQAYTKDAVRRGDRYAETSIRYFCNCSWLARDASDEARSDLERASWTPPERGFHVQHYYELWARAEIALYSSDTAAMDELAPRFDQLSRSLLTRVQIIRAESHWLRGRLALATNAKDKQVSRSARRLEREGLGCARVWALLLRAGIARHDRNDALAITTLREATRAALELDMQLCAEAARRRVGELIGGSEGHTLIAQADEWMAGEDIVNPGGMTDVITPGF